jgi:hypothetical protein
MNCVRRQTGTGCLSIVGEARKINRSEIKLEATKEMAITFIRSFSPLEVSTLSVVSVPA